MSSRTLRSSHRAPDMDPYLHACSLIPTRLESWCLRSMSDYHHPLKMFPPLLTFKTVTVQLKMDNNVFPIPEGRVCFIVINSTARRTSAQGSHCPPPQHLPSSALLSRIPLLPCVTSHLPVLMLLGAALEPTFLLVKQPSSQTLGPSGQSYGYVSLTCRSCSPHGLPISAHDPEDTFCT